MKLKLSLLTTLVALSYVTYGAQVPSEYNDRDKYMYEKLEVIVEPAEGESVPGDTNGPVVLEDKVISDYLTTKKVKTFVTQQTKDGKTVRVTETWTTRTPSYTTWANMPTGTTLPGDADLALYTTGLNVKDFQQLENELGSKFRSEQNDASAIPVEGNELGDSAPTLLASNDVANLVQNTTEDVQEQEIPASLKFEDENVEPAVASLDMNEVVPVSLNKTEDLDIDHNNEVVPASLDELDDQDTIEA